MNRLARLMLLSGLFLVANSELLAAGNKYEETYNIGYVSGNVDGGTEYGEVPVTGFVLSARNKVAVLEFVKMTSSEGNLLTTGAIAGDTWETNLQGFYYSLLGEGQPYMKFKVGSIKQEMVEMKNGVITPTTTTITSYGLGFGYRFGSRIMLEFDMTTLDNDMTLIAATLLF